MNMLLDGMLLTDWELYLQDWGMELTLEFTQECLVPESGIFQRETELMIVQGIMLREELQPHLENKVGYPETERAFLLSKKQLAAEQSLMVCNILIENQRYEIVRHDAFTHHVHVFCKKVGNLP